MKILCVLIPHFPVKCELLRHPESDGRPFVIIHGIGSQKFVLDASPEFEKLSPGIPVSEALSWYGEAPIITADADYYQSEFNALLETLETCSPLVEGAELGRAYVGMDGLELIYPEDGAFIRAVTDSLPVSFAPCLGIARGKFPAYLAACHSQPGRYTAFSGDLATSIGSISCDLLPVSQETKDKLHRFGLDTLSQVAAIPPGPLGAQFGPEGLRMLELARGEDTEPLLPLRLQEVIEESTELSEVTVSLETIMATVEHLVKRALSRDSLKGRGIRSLQLWTRSWRAEHWEHAVNFKDPAVAASETMPRIRYFLDRFPQPGPVEQVGLKLTRLGYGVNRQWNLFTEIRAQHHLLQNIKELQSRLGSPPVFKVTAIEPWSRLPERRYVLSSVS